MLAPIPVTVSIRRNPSIDELEKGKPKKWTERACFKTLIFVLLIVAILLHFVLLACLFIYIGPESFTKHPSLFISCAVGIIFCSFGLIRLNSYAQAAA